MSAALPPARFAPMQVTAMWRAQESALVLLGHASTGVPRTGTVKLASEPGARGLLRAIAWPLAEGQIEAFIAAVRLPDHADPADGATLLLRGARAADRDMPVTLPPTLGEAEFGRAVAQLVGAHAPSVARFMLEILQPQPGADMHRPSAMLSEFLVNAAQPDGCVELMLSVPDRCVLLQGWGAYPTAPFQVVLAGDALSCFQAEAATFARADVPAPATGIMLALPPDAAPCLAGLGAVFLLSADRLHRSTLHERRLLDPSDSIGHIRAMQSTLSCSESMRSLLRSTLHYRYEGRDTLNTGERPVRAAIDLAAATQGIGAYLSGWVFDPAGKLASLELCAEGFAAPLDPSWIRVSRDDVSAAFRNEAAFPPPRTHDAGFAVATTAAPLPDQAAYLRFTFTDGECAFMPLQLAGLDEPGIRETLLGSIDLYKPSGLSIIEQHLAPLIARMPLSAPQAAAILQRGPLQRAQAIVLPLAVPMLPRTFISGFLQDPPDDDEQLVFVCGPVWDQAGLASLRALIRFYDLPATILACRARPSPACALREASLASQASAFLLVQPDLSAPEPGWRHALRAAARGRAFVCPTVLYEDWSTRYAGATDLVFPDGAPYAEIRIPSAGLPRPTTGLDAPAPINSGTFACCLVQRSALPALDTVEGFLTETGQEAAFFRRLRDLGLTGLWLPSVQVYAPEQDAAEDAKIIRLVDFWVLRHACQGEPKCAS